MARTIEEPTEKEGGLSRRDGMVYDHPAFGQISLSRLSGTAVLYGSDFKHRNCVRITIKESALHRDLSRDWYFAGREIATVEMSEAQWATFVSSFGVGEGVPCTIRSVDGKQRPEFPLRDSGQEYKIEVDAKLTASVAAIDKAMAAATENAGGLSKAKLGAILEPLQRARMELAANAPFIAKSFGEHMETRVEKAKVEVNAYMTETIVRAGLENLRAPLLLETDKPE